MARELREVQTLEGTIPKTKILVSLMPSDAYLFLNEWLFHYLGAFPDPLMQMALDGQNRFN